MKRILLLATVVACSLVSSVARTAAAAEPQRCPICGGYHPQGSHPNSPGGYSQNGYNSGGYSQGGTGLPQGRRYYNGRYFGNLNNRYYGPQYGYF